MPTFEVWDVVRVPFPYTDRPVREHRPALVVAARSLEERHGLLWVVMVTSAENRGWTGDVAVSDLVATGLPAPSVVRTAKIATIQAREATRLGSLPASDRVAVAERLHEAIGAAASSR
jgi:mRNA interferase MazF